MKDPYLKDHESYLNNLDRFSAPKRKPSYIIDKGIGFQFPLRAVTVLGAIFAVVACIPWGI